MRKRPKPAYVPRGLPTSTAPEGHDNRPRSWLVVGLVGMVYLAGIAGLWSMITTFEDVAPGALTPAGVDGTLPPLDETIDVRDAHLEDPFVPKFRPLISNDSDVAASGLQERG